MKKILKKYSHAWPLLYIFIYFPWFLWLEQRIHIPHTMIHTRFDDFIPFVSAFVIPYFIWFLYIPAVVLFFFFYNKKEYFRLIITLFVGMSICLFICTVWPNGQELRVTIDKPYNFLEKLIIGLYKADTNTNVFPSIHAYNSLVANFAILKSQALKNKSWLKISSLILTILICLSTVFLKQHSILDVIGALALAFIMIFLVYYLPKLIRTS